SPQVGDGFSMAQFSGFDNFTSKLDRMEKVLVMTGAPSRRSYKSLASPALIWWLGTEELHLLHCGSLHSKIQFILHFETCYEEGQKLSPNGLVILMNSPKIPQTLQIVLLTNFLFKKCQTTDLEFYLNFSLDKSNHF
ncbi:hypothetical protein ACJX0J_025047, partial [Zea mays]